MKYLHENGISFNWGQSFDSTFTGFENI